ncbi:hypothetical protein CYANOKiyG1_10740 [Okeania sp. KiyG1]|nr:hypothetical protein CYANOKiyG1_10740 [Okeania sp. KiyG1]
MGRWGDGEMGRWGDGGMGRWGDEEMRRWGDGEIKKYLVMVEDGTFFYTELNGFDIIPRVKKECFCEVKLQLLSN